MKKILIVDDEKITLGMTKHILDLDYETFCAKSGKDAIRIYKAERPDMIVSNLQMPDMSGFELQSTLQHQYAERIPVIFMTAAAEDEEIEIKGVDIKSINLIRKPFRADVLLDKVEEVFARVKKVRGNRVPTETDPMTGLYNKSSSQLEIGDMCREVKGTLMMIDIDNFKQVNDVYGHNMGDKILIRFAEIVRAAVRNNDIAGRMGGDEFIAFCQNVSSEEIIAGKDRFMNEELLKSAKEFMGEDMNIPLGVSVGAVMAPDEGTDFLTLYRKADKALAAAKQEGKHKHNLYVEDKKDKDGKENPVSDIEKEMLTLGESSMGKGAYKVSANEFKTIYRFLTRVGQNYQKENRLIIFTISPGEGSKKLGDAVSKFNDSLCNSLRNSDVVTLSGKNKVELILLEAGALYCEMVIERVLENWKKLDPSEKFEVTYEVELIR
ncbi:diguanylate cyclase response regulator [Butyrivibrio sp. MB2005]|uniref:diguanylate cyclase response regulator n=1 Tax=Butyrivibrio sp. MB2005 TaxID=1280678 RepID=UPI00041B4EE5|nr:diguanylate cyclase [Butyrivibrio sp. MB2005]